MILKSWFSTLHRFYVPFVAMYAAVWGAESVSQVPSRAATSLVACQTGDSRPDPYSVLSYPFHRLSLVSFDVSNYSFVLLSLIASLQCLDFT